jgi:hypothetical protein
MYRVLTRGAAVVGWIIVILPIGGAFGFFALAKSDPDRGMGIVVLAGFAMLYCFPVLVGLRLFAWCCKPEPQRLEARQRPEIDVLDRFR